MSTTSEPEQPATRGTGPLLERRYFIDLARPHRSATELMQHVQAHLPEFSPAALADFRPRQPGRGGLQVGDEFYIDMLGPWDGTVRVTEAGPTRFELATLAGHPEAGRICFEAHQPDGQPDQLHFEIHSWARSRDGLVALAYDQLGGGRRVQEATWVEFCRRVAAYCGGTALGPVTVVTIRRQPGEPATETRHHV